MSGAVSLHLPPGGTVPLPAAAVTFTLPGPAALLALVVDDRGRCRDGGDVVFPGAPDAPGVAARRGAITVAPGLLRPGAAAVVLLAEPPARGPAELAVVTVSGTDGRVLARLDPPAPRVREQTILATVLRHEGVWLLAAAERLPSGAPAPEPVVPVIPMAVDEHGVLRYPPPGYETGVVLATNDERARHGLGALTVDARLSVAAQRHSDDMVRRGFFAHADPDGREVQDRVVDQGYPWRVVAENIAFGQVSPRAVVQAWMDSPGHRANILLAGTTHIGVGRAVGGRGLLHWTQVFATPA